MVLLQSCNHFQRLLHLTFHHDPLPVTSHSLTSQALAIVPWCGLMAEPLNPGRKRHLAQTPSNLSSLNPHESFRAVRHMQTLLAQPRHPDFLRPRHHRLLQPADDWPSPLRRLTVHPCCPHPRRCRGSGPPLAPVHLNSAP